MTTMAEMGRSVTTPPRDDQTVFSWAAIKISDVFWEEIYKIVR